MINRMIGGGIALVLMASAPVEGLACCSGDFDSSFIVDGADLASLLSPWGQDGAADLNGDETVDGADLAALLAVWGGCPELFYPEPVVGLEAHQIALETLGAFGPLFPSEELQQRIARDLQSIRAFEPTLEPQIHTLAWAPTRILAQLDMQAPQEAYECKLAYYQGVEDELAFGFYIIDFPGRLNVLRAAADFETTPPVFNAQPDSLLGGENFWTIQFLINGNWRWTVDDGFLDCFDGCDCHRLFIFDVTPGGEVMPVSYQEIGPSYCDFGPK